MVMFLLSRILAGLYLATPPAAAALAVWQARRARPPQSPLAHKPIVAFLLTCVSSLILGSAIVLVYAHATEARPSVGQVALTCYVFVAVLSLLKGLSWLLKEGTSRLFLLSGKWRRLGPSWHARMTGATVLRAILLAVIGLPYVMAVGMVYRPKVVGSDDILRKRGYPYEHVTFPSADGVPLDAWWIPAVPSTANVSSAEADQWGKRTILLCHGLGANKANQLDVAINLPARGYNLLTFDFRAHGASGGQISTFGDLERRDVLGAVHWVRTTHPEQSQRLFGLGMSMGGAALIAASADPGPDGQAIDAVAVYDTYDDLGALAEDLSNKYFLPPLSWLSTHVALPLASAHAGADLADFRPAAVVDGLAPRPLLVIHARGDQVIGFEHGVRLFQAAAEPKLRCWIGKYKPVPGHPSEKAWLDSDDLPADHNGVILSNEAGGAVQSFFAWSRQIL